MMFKKLSIFFIMITPITLFAGTGGLSPQEVQLCQYLSDKKDAQLLLLEKLVNINSGSENLEGVQKVGELLWSEFEALGFKVRWGKGVTPMKRAAMLIAERQGSKGKRLLLLGHLDTVFPKESPFQHFKRSGNTAMGPGVIDIKGGDVIILYALKALAASHALEDTTIRVVLTGDEESTAKPISVSRKPLIDLAKVSDIALDFEPTIRDHVSVGRRGITHWSIQTKGKEGHSSRIFSNEFGNGAIFEMTRILNDMRIALGSEKSLTFNPGAILGGADVDFDTSLFRGSSFGKNNIISKITIANGDLRYLSSEQKKQAEKTIETIVSRNLPGTSATVQFQEVLPPMPPTDENLKLFEQYRRVSEKLGNGNVQLLPPELRGGGDIQTIAPYVSMGLVGIGANGRGEHSLEESLEVDSLVIQAQRAALLIYQLTRIE